MNKSAWDSYITNLASEFQRRGSTKRDDIRNVLSSSNYSTKSRGFVKEFSGGGSTTPNISVDKTISRINKKTRQNTALLRARRAEIAAGEYDRTIAYVNSYARELRNRARTIRDSAELARTKKDILKVQKIQKSIRGAKKAELKGVLNSALKTVNDVQFNKAIRSSLNAQVRSVAITERTKKINGDFYGSVKKETTLIDVVLSAAHVIYDICDEVAQAGPYTKDNLPALPLHPFCECRYRSHNDKTEKLNTSREGKGSQKKSKIVPELAKDVY